jgi:hypothetical protein
MVSLIAVICVLESVRQRKMFSNWKTYVFSISSTGIFDLRFFTKQFILQVSGSESEIFFRIRIHNTGWYRYLYYFTYCTGIWNWPEHKCRGFTFSFEIWCWSEFQSVKCNTKPCSALTGCRKLRHRHRYWLLVTLVYIPHFKGTVSRDFEPLSSAMWHSAGQ